MKGLGFGVWGLGSSGARAPRFWGSGLWLSGPGVWLLATCLVSGGAVCGERGRKRSDKAVAGLPKEGETATEGAEAAFCLRVEVFLFLSATLLFSISD